MERDPIDEFIERVAVEWPQIDIQVEAAVDRVGKIHKMLDRSLAETLVGFGINPGEFKLLVRLRSTGPPHRLSPGELSRVLDLSTGAMTNRLDGLEQGGLVARRPDPADRRGIIVDLTPTGKDLIDRAIIAQAAKEAEHLSVLNETEKRKLNDLLRKVVLSFHHAKAGAAAPRA